MFLFYNLNNYKDGQLRIIATTKNNGFKKYTTQGNGNLPKSFVGLKFGDKNGCTVQQGKGKQYESYNANISYDETYGDFKFTCDVASRRGRGFHWQCLKPTNDILPL